ncbi:TonB-dependent receptor [Thalassomonas actiniarum]|uniref:TonB-dependent receptor n=1 Tax=Thalassomonas actiniarum TaxID=485447 RepID=A0AAF0C2N4_9GAMM|nr:TonB-dependent receptor [Thalassomonas actiniarum]WDD97839.1 TonB-dependent receptor [Thalassomonas actiniarum]
MKLFRLTYLHLIISFIALPCLYAPYGHTSSRPSFENHPPKAGKHHQKNEDSGLETITVTAQKQEQNLLEVPLAITLLNREQIEMTYAANIEQLQSLVPSLSFRKGNTTRNSALTLRGIGTISFSIAAEPSVSTVVDGVVLGRSGQAFSGLYDLERIEVLRGPQGTLFGKNASAGVVNIVTREPDDDFTASITTSYFQQDEYRLNARMSGPLSDSISGSLSLLRAGFNGHLSNVYTRERADGYNHQGARGILQYKNDKHNRELKFILEYFDADDTCCTDIEGLPSGFNSTSEAAPDSRGIVDGVADIDLGQRKIDHDFTTKTLDKTSALSFHIEQDYAKHHFHAISAYRRWENTEIREGDFSSTGGKTAQPVDFSSVFYQMHDIGPQLWQQFSQEFRLSSINNDPDNNGNSYQLGAFFWYQDVDRNFTRFASCQNDKGQNQDILQQNPGLTCLATEIVDARADMYSKFINYALYGSGEYLFREDLHLLYGLRFGHDKLSYHHKRVNNDPWGRAGVGVQRRSHDTRLNGETRDNKLSIKLGARYHLSGSGQIYGHWSQGYKGPGFNVYYNMKPTETGVIDAEQSDAFELGLKYNQNNLLLTSALFYSRFTGFQANNFDCSTGVCITRLTNAGDVSTRGIEADFFWQAGDNLEFYGGVSLVRAQIDKFNCPLEQACSARSGLEVPFSPDRKYSIAANYYLATQRVQIKINASYNYTDEQYAELPDNEGIFSPAALLASYGLWNAAIEFSFADDQYRLSLIGKNLADNSYTNTYSGSGFRYKIPRNADRYFGLSLQINFE